MPEKVPVLRQVLVKFLSGVNLRLEAFKVVWRYLPSIIMGVPSTYYCYGGTYLLLLWGYLVPIIVMEVPTFYYYVDT